jgi:hypothetical protein
LYPSGTVGQQTRDPGGRRARVRDILGFIARTFDPGKCAKGSVNVGKYDAWAAKRFPNGLAGGDRYTLTEEGEVVRLRGGLHVTPAFIAVFMAVAEFALLTDKNEDDSLPHNRARGLWDSLFEKGLVPVKFCARKWAVCREELVKQGVVAITDRNYGPDKAMKWAPGPYFPFLGLWKAKNRPSPLGPGDLASVPRGEGRRTTTTSHNTLLPRQPVGPGVIDRWRRSRSPPWGAGVC